jgi:glycosyltransferase involved in cell wall biosynthesis
MSMTGLITILLFFKMARVKLLIVNYTLDEQHPLLSHQVDVARALSQRFKDTIILPTSGVKSLTDQNLHVLSVQKSRSRVVGFLQVSWLFLYGLFRFRPKNIFFHMNANYAMIFAPIARLFGIKVILWYTHKSMPLSLFWAKVFVSQIVTASKDSLTLKSGKIIEIGHHVGVSDVHSFRLDSQSVQFFVVSRLHRSKNLHEVVEQFSRIQAKVRGAHLYFIGPLDDTVYHKEVLSFTRSKNVQNVRFLGPLSHSQIQQWTTSNTIGLHASQGSLDKFPLEFVGMGLPVLSSNPIMLRLFGSWKDSGFTSLHDEFMALENMEQKLQLTELKRRQGIILLNHSLDSWVRHFSLLLK